ncbi:MAG TPA: circularly permuted type 2 ATP-grasp protein, partial [Gammaproteobacteria bacterium]|nr:circularly permuted type 2 ATP-grasp protein [Gammaproteobacteria bacterium]
MSATTGVYSEASSSLSELLGAYRALPGIYDALVDANGAVRPGWTATLAALAGMSEQDRGKLNEAAQRILRENGVTFVAQDDADSTSRPWRLDLFPMLIAPAEWQALEVGLIQRARLLNELLGDLYGP